MSKLGHPPTEKPRPRYEVVHDVLRASILSGRVKQGVVLIEGPIADLFDSSRAPVRKALKMLHGEGLIRRFEGRGYLVAHGDGEVTPLRLTLDEQTLGLPADVGGLFEARPAVDRIFDDVERAVATCVTFGHFRLLDTVIADAYGVSRTVVREVLMRLQDRGLVEKDARSHWVAGPLTARAVGEYFQLRRLLEPVALRESADRLDRDRLAAMRARLDALIAGRATLDADAIARIEDDLHGQCLKHCRNRRMMAIIRQSQLPMQVNRVFFSGLGIHADEPTLQEHRLVIAHLARGAVTAAAVALDAHLEAALERTLERLKVLSVFPEPDLPDYLVRIS